MIAFFEQHRHPDTLKLRDLYVHLNDVERVSKGEDMWESEHTKALRHFAETRILPLASSTHRVEAMVRECSHVASTDRGEQARSHYIFLRSVMSSKINDIARHEEELRRLNRGEDDAKVRRGRGKKRVKVALKFIKERGDEADRAKPEDRKTPDRVG